MSSTVKKSTSRQSEVQPDESHALTTAGGVFSTMAVFVGGGIVTLPNAFYTTGLVVGMVIMLCVGSLTINRAWLYMKTKDFIPGKPESMYEIGYYLFGRKIIFVISFMLALLNFGTIIGLLKIFGGICGSLVQDATQVSTLPPGLTFLTYDSFWMIGLCVAITPICLKKEIEELYIVTVLLFTAVMSFFAVLFLQFVFYGRSEFSQGRPLTIHEVQWPKKTDNPIVLDMIPPLTLMIFCFAFTSNLFPIYSALKVKTNENGLKVFGIATVIAVFVFSGVSLLGLMIFGQNVTKNGGNLISNINQEVRLKPEANHWEAYVMRILYFIIIVTHVPPIFFPGKEAILIMVDEIDRRSISNTLEERIKQLKLMDANMQLAFEEGDDLDNSIKEELDEAGRVSTSQDTRPDGSQIRKTGDEGVAVRRTAHNQSRMSSHQSMIRAQKNTRSTIDGVRKSRVTSIVSTIRETQTLVAYVKPMKKANKKANLKGSQVSANDDEEEAGSEDGSEEQVVSNKLAYKDMKDGYYYSASLLSLALICFLACVVPNVSIVFNLVSIVSCNCTSFFFPSLFYINAAKRYYASKNGLLSQQDKSDGDHTNTRSTQTFIPYNKQLMGWAYFQLVLGIVIFPVGVFQFFYEIFSE